MSFRFTWKQKRLFTQMLLFVRCVSQVCGVQKFGPTSGWYPVTPECWFFPWLDPCRPASSLEQVDYFPVCSTQVSDSGWFPYSPEFVVSLLAFFKNALNICGDSIQICCGIVWEDCVEQREPNLVQTLKETTELHPAGREQAGFVARGALGRANPWGDWVWGAGLSDSINAPKHTPWKNLRIQGGTPHPENL